MISKELLLTTKKEKKISILAHYYTSPIIQDVADFVGDSLALAQYAHKNNIDNIILCGVSFMAETIKILCPSSNVYIPVLNSPCSLADSCDVQKIRKFKNLHPNALVVTYVNSSIDVKIESDIIITSSNALKIVNSIDDDKEIIICPDYNLGAYIKEKTNKNIILYQGACHVHNRFSLSSLNSLIDKHPNAIILGHPELSHEMREKCNFLGSTSAILDFPKQSDAAEFIILTEFGISHKLKTFYPNKKFYFVDDISGNNNICHSMKLINESNLYDCLMNGTFLVDIEEEKLLKASVPIKKMLSLS